MNTLNAEETKIIIKNIVALFYQNVKGKKPETSSSNIKHDGKEGHWLETQMGIAHNANNSPDLFGFEMKNNTSSKTTFGDWSADFYVFKDKKNGISRDDFLKIFGKPNKLKKGRYSWSGSPCPQINKTNIFGQKLIVDKNANILAIYDYSKDNRKDKSRVVPSQFQVNNLILAKWKARSLKKKLEDKFNMRGWFKCSKNEKGIYTKIDFGEPINFNNWIKGVKKGLIFLDSGMYQGNLRNYSQWRAYNKYWNELIVATY